MKTLINFADKFGQFGQNYINEQRRLLINSCLNVYYGINIEGHLRISFISRVKPFQLISTKEIKVTQGKESDEVYWTCFDLLNNDAKDVFFIFCDSLVETIENIADEYVALSLIRERYYSWKLLLKNKGKMSYEDYQGLYGELLYIAEYLSRAVGFEDAIKSWVGPEGHSKDFSLGETWYEVKTIGTSSISVKINSLAQLDSNVNGHLVIVTVEKMSTQFENKLSNVLNIYRYILDNLISREIKEDFINKVLKYGFFDDDNVINNYEFEVKNVRTYLVGKDFPKLTRESVKSNAISHVNYEILISAIDKYEEN